MFSGGTLYRLPSIESQKTFSTEIARIIAQRSRIVFPQCKKGRFPDPFLFQTSLTFSGFSAGLLNMNHFAARIEGAMYANFLAFELLYLVLGVDIISGATSGILKHVLVARFHDRTGEDLDSSRWRLSL